MLENKYRVTKVCVDSYEHRILKGRLYNPFSERPIHFNSTIDFLLKMDDLMTVLECPQAFSEVRRFRYQYPKEDLFAPPVRPTKEGPGSVCTFMIRMMFRQNASWQGCLIWSDEKREENFRSVLELLFLIDNATYSG